MSYAIPVQTALETYLSHIQRCHPCAASQFDLFAQDAWRLKPSLTLNYGLRWEWNTPQADAAKQIQAFRPGQATGIFPCVLSSPDPLRGGAGQQRLLTARPCPLGISFGNGFPGRSGSAIGAHEQLPVGLCSAAGVGLVTELVRRLAGGSLRRTGQVQRPHGLGDVLQQQRGTVGEFHRPAPIRRQHLN